MATQLTYVSSEDVYTRMLELNFPEELALRFKNEMKDGLFSYVMSEDSPFVKSQDVTLLMALVKLLASYMGGRHEEKANRIGSSCMSMLMSEPWPMFAMNHEESATTTQKETATSSETAIVKKEKQPLRNLSNVLSLTSSSGSGVEYDRGTSQEGSQKKHQQKDMQPQALTFEPSNIRMLISERLVTLPKFSPHIEAQLNCEEVCLQALPNACMELACFFDQSNLDVRKSSEYRMIAQTILNRYEILDGILNRCILNGWLATGANPPKTSQAHVTKALQNAMVKMRSIRKRATQKAAFLINYQQNAQHAI